MASTQFFVIQETAAAGLDVTISSAAGDAQGTTWDVSGGVLTSTSNATINSTTISSLLGNANLTIDATSLLIQDSITATNGYNLILKATSNIRVVGGVAISTGGGNVIFQSDSDASGSGSTRLGGGISGAAGVGASPNSAADSTVGKISSGGGNIVFSGGTDINTGFAKASADYGYIGGTKPRAGVAIFGFNVDAGGGNITIRSSGGTNASSTRALLIEQNVTTRASFSTTGSGSISLIGDGSAIATSTSWGIAASGVNISTSSGDISLVGKGNTAYSNARGIATSNVNYQSTSGSITLIDETDGSAANYNGSYFGAPNVFSTNNTIMIKSDKFQNSGSAKFTLTCSTATFQSYSSASFAGTPGFDEIDASNCQTLNIGASGNTSGLTFGSPINVGGALNLIGAAIAINNTVTASSTITLTASGNVTQSGRISASGLRVLGSGNFTLTTDSNSVTTLSVGSSGARVGSFSFFNSSELTIGTVSSSSGIYSSETITVATKNGNLNITHPISTNAPVGDRIVLYANKAQANGNVGTGNITFSGSGSIGIESGARALLYSGSRPESSGLVSAVGGEVNARSLIDSSTVISAISPTVSSTGSFAFFRTDTPSPLASSSGSAACSNPNITKLSSNRGSSTGGYEVTVYGTNLTSPIYLNNRPVEIISLSTTSAVIRVPAGTKGKTSVQISGCSGTTLTDFYYEPDPTITELSSRFISTSGGKLEIFGKFLSGASISLSNESVNLVSASDSSIQISFLESAPGAKTFELRTIYGLTEFVINFVNPPKILTKSQPVYLAQGDQVAFKFATSNANSISISGSFPNGLELNSATGEVTGTSLQSGTFNFELSASNQVGVATHLFNFIVDKPTPKPISANLYFGYRSSSLNSTNERALDRLISKIKSVSPLYLSPTLKITGLAGSSSENNESLIRYQIHQYLLKSGIPIASVSFGSGPRNRLNLTLVWPR
jgi:hypothetical protein